MAKWWPNHGWDCLVHQIHKPVIRHPLDRQVPAFEFSDEEIKAMQACQYEFNHWQEVIADRCRQPGDTLKVEPVYLVLPDHS